MTKLTVIDIKLLKDRIEKSHGAGAWETLEDISSEAKMIVPLIVPQTKNETATVDFCAKKRKEIAESLHAAATAINELCTKCKHVWWQINLPSLISEQGALQLQFAANSIGQEREPVLALERAVLAGRTTTALRAAVHLVVHVHPDIHARFLRASPDETSAYIPEDVLKALCHLTRADLNSVKQTVKTSGFENVLGLRRSRK